MNNIKTTQSSFSFFRLFLIAFLSLAISCSTDNIRDEVLDIDGETPEEIVPDIDEEEPEEESEEEQEEEDVEDEMSDMDEEAPEDEEEDEMPDMDEEEPEEEEMSDMDEERQACEMPSNFIFNEENGLVVVEFEEAEFSEDWRLRSDGGGFSGEGYMVWEGSQNLSNPGVGTVSYKIEIKNTGIYRFIWRSAVKTGDNGTDHNDTWLRFNDADDFYAEKGTSIVYPKDTGKTPNPEGATKDGWFKVYRSGSNLDFKWQSSTFDNNAHDIFVTFENPGIYTMEISARSSGHGIDKFALFNEDFTQTEATADSNNKSEITCDN